MGAIKGVFLVFFSILLIISSFFSILFFSLNQSMAYNNFENTSLKLVNNYLINNDSLNSVINEETEFLKLYCEENPHNLSLSELSYSFNFSDYKIKIPCDKINDTSFLINESVRSLVHEIYFKDYNCSFIDCFNKEQIPTFLASEKTYLLLRKTFFIFLIISLSLLIFIFLLLKNKINILLLASIPIFVSSFLFLKLNSILISFFGKEDLIKEIIDILFYSSNKTSIRLIILSGILFSVWIILKIFKSSVKIKEKFDKIKEKMQKIKEINKQEKTQEDKTQNKNAKNIEETETNEQNKDKNNKKEDDF
ncbi:hypothetical protein GYA25_01410 [Candidatus Woesearchaeota archaeon]|nr:hypothetical protein [Candidatus Woesearchaeota archaeon]